VDFLYRSLQLSCATNPQQIDTVEFRSEMCGLWRPRLPASADWRPDSGAAVTINMLLMKCKMNQNDASENIATNKIASI